MAEYIVSSGETESGIILENNFMTVLDGGTANSTTVNSRGRLDVSSGGIATDIMENGGYVYVADGAEASFVPNTFTDLNLYYDYEATVHSGTTANNTMLNGGSIRIFSGGTAIVTRNRNGNGRIFVSNGGLTSLTHVNRPVGYENIAVFSGGLADFTVLNGSMNVSNGGSAINTIINSVGIMRVSSGGIVNNAIVNSCGLLVVSSGGTATNIVVNEGEIAFSLSPDTFVQGICDGQAFLVRESVVSGLVINQSESPSISEGEKAEDTTIVYGGLIVSNGGTINNTKIGTRKGRVAHVLIHSGGVANNTTIDYRGNLQIYSGGIANGVTANSGAALNVSSGGIVNEAEINATRMMVNSGGIVNSITVGTRAALIVHSGVTATAVRENGGYVSIYEGADVSFVPNTFGGLVISMFSASLHSGTTANDTIVNSSGKLYVWSGGIARDVLVIKNGELAVSSGGKLTGRVIDLGGKVSLADGATLDFDLTQVNPGTGARVNNLTKMFGSYVNQNLTITIKADQDEGLYKLAEGAADFNRTLSVMNTAGETIGTLAVGESISISGNNYSLLLLDNTLSLKVGNAEPVSPYTSDGLVFSSGTVVVESGEVFHDTIMGGGTLNINSGGTLKTAALYGSGRVYVSSGGIAEDVVVRNNSRGSFDILDGGTLNGATVFEGAILRISSGGTAVEVRENGGYVDVQDGANVSFVSHTFSDGILGTATLHSGTTAYRATLTSGGKLYLSGGMANDIQIESSEGSIFVLDGGRASGITFLSAGRTVIHISSGGVVDNVSNNEASFSMSIFDGGSADNVSLSRAGRLFVSNGGTATNVRIESSAIISAQSGAILNGITVQSGASFVVSSGVTALNIVENGGLVNVLDGAEVSFVSNTISGLCLSGGSLVIHSGTTLVNTFLGSETNPRMYVSEGGVAINTWIDYGSVSVSCGGMINSATIDSGSIYVFADGTANSTMVNGGGIRISSGGMANATMVCGGGITVKSGGIANSTTVNSGGSMNVSSGGKLTGQMSFANGAVVSAEEGSILDFDISEFMPEAGARVKNLSLIQGTPIYTLTVSNSQADGTYTLAEGASIFDTVITVQNILGDALTTLTVSSEEDLNGTKYSLKLEDDVLSVTLSKLLPAENPADKDTDDYLYDKKKGMNADAESFETNILNADTTLINVDQKFSVYNADSSGKLWHNFVGIDDTIDFAKITLEHAATLSFNLDATDATKFTVWSLTEGKDKKDNTTWTQKSLQATTLKKVKGSTDYAATTKALLLNAGDYYVSMQSTNKKNGYALYNVTLSEDSTFYTDGDNTDDWTDMKENGATSEEYATIGTITADTGLVLDNWVGFGDSVDYAQFSLDSASKLSFVANATDATKFTVYKLTQDKKGKWSLKSLQSTTLKKAKGAEDYSATTKGLLLETGEYYIAMESTNAKKGGNAYYTVKLGTSTFYDAGDDGWNNYVYDKKTEEPLNLAEFVTTEITSGTTNIQLDLDPANEAWNNFVGFGDAVDYARIILSADATLSFSLTATDAAKFTIYRLNEGKKASSYTMKSLQATTLKKAKDDELFSATTKALSLSEGEYYICMQSTNAAKGGSAFYNVELNHALCSGLPDAGIAAAMDIPEGTLGMQNGGLLA